MKAGSGIDGAAALRAVVGQRGQSQRRATEAGALLPGEHLMRIGQDFSNQHLADQKLPPDQRRPYTIVIGMRSWLMAALADMHRRKP